MDIPRIIPDTRVDNADSILTRVEVLQICAPLGAPEPETS